jgi:hypothetical protein
MMRVGLMNLGDATRVFHNKINRMVTVPVGRVVVTDLDARAVQDLKFPARPETVLVCHPDATIPEEMEKIIALLTTIEFEEPHIILQKFHEIAPPNNLKGSMRPSRMQMRMVLRSMVEDYISEQIHAESGDKPLIKDDVDPNVLQRELDRQMDNEEPEPMHPLRQEKIDKAIIENRPASRAPARVAAAQAAARAREPAKTKKRKAKRS